MAIVHAYSDGVAYEVEFITAEGRTIMVLALTAADVWPLAAGETHQVREGTALAA